MVGRLMEARPLCGSSLDVLWWSNQKLPCPCKAGCEVRLDVRVSDVSVEPRSCHELRRLIPHSTEHEVQAGRMQDVGKVLQGMQPRRIDRGHVAQTQHDDR